MKFYLVSLILFVAAIGLSKHWSNEAASSVALAQQQGGGTTLVSGYQCPTSHPIKGDFTGPDASCVFHAPGSQSYEKIKPGKCFASPAEAIANQCRAAKL